MAFLGPEIIERKESRSAWRRQGLNAFFARVKILTPMVKKDAMENDESVFLQKEKGISSAKARFFGYILDLFAVG